MSKRNLGKKIRDSTKSENNSSNQKIDKLNINTLEHQKDFTNKRVRNDTKFKDKRLREKSRFIKSNENVRGIANAKTKLKRELNLLDNQNAEKIEDIKRVYDNRRNRLYNASTDEENKKEEKIVKTNNKRKNYVVNELFTRDKKENSTKTIKNNVDDISAGIKDIEILDNINAKTLKDSFDSRRILNVGAKNKHRFNKVLSTGTNLMAEYMSYGSDENIGAKASEESLAKTSDVIKVLGRYKSNRKFNLIRNRQKQLSRINHKLQKRKSKLEYKERLKLLSTSNHYKQKSLYQKWLQRKQMKKLIYQKYQITFKDRIKNKAKEILLGFAKSISKNAKKIGGGLVAFLILIMMMFQLISSLGSVLGGSSNTILTTSYLSDENVLSSINQEFSNLEYNLQDEIDSVEENYPNYDEYIIYKDDIGHNVHVILSYITSRYGVIKTVSDVKDEITNLFDDVYDLKYEEEIEIRYKTQYYSYFDEDGIEQEGSYEIPYEYKKMVVTLTKKEMDTIVRDKLSYGKDNLWHYETLLKTKGNMEDVFGSGSNRYNEIIYNKKFENPGITFDDTKVKELFNEAEKHIGKRYVFGANGPANFDCSSFVCYSYTNSGLKNMPRTTAWRIYTDYTIPISPSEAKAGDIIFFKNTYNSGSPISHVGIYAGSGMMIHAGDPIQYTSIETPYWREHFYGFGRIR